MFLGEFADEPRRQRRLPEATDTPVRRKIDFRLPAGPRQSNVGEPSLFLQTRATVVVERSLMRKETLLPSRQENNFEFETFRSMQRHYRDARAILRTFDVHHQRHVLEEGPEFGKLAHRADELLEIVKPPRGVRGPVCLPHVDVAAFLENLLSQLLVCDFCCAHPPQVESRQEIAQDLPWTGLQLLCLHQHLRRTHEGNTGAAPVFVQCGQGRFSEAAFGLVVDALEREIVVRLCDATQIRERVSDFRSFIEARASDYFVG